ncbi:unnamed protein product [Bursaphelenchus xylophilus]|uniref:(pine wood nematode) hypothetical protein n=1 Tax=Bursaphelenchus xylophilus TaxID=6326 RepID=A0A1I7RW26_BURXY|nr:unnamed protein product [Bursaphelenchus xylophilus]CAG9095041.1 unnamed protein product [Bursaphelenchus xylophilus]
MKKLVTWVVVLLGLVSLTDGQAGTLIQYIPPAVQAALPTKLAQSLSVLTWQDVSKAASIIDIIPKYTSVSQFLRTIDINTPQLSAVLSSNINDQYTQYMQTEAGLSEKAKAYIAKLKEMAKDATKQAKALYESKDPATKANIQLTFPTMTKIIGSEQVQSMLA